MCTHWIRFIRMTAPVMCRALSKTYLSTVECCCRCRCNRSAHSNTSIGRRSQTIRTHSDWTRRRWSAMTTNCMPMKKTVSTTEEQFKWIAWMRMHNGWASCVRVAATARHHRRLDPFSFRSHCWHAYLHFCVECVRDDGIRERHTERATKTTRNNGHLSLKWTTIKHTHKPNDK